MEAQNTHSLEDNDFARRQEEIEALALALFKEYHYGRGYKSIPPTQYAKWLAVARYAYVDTSDQ